MDLALNNLQRLICHKTQQTKPNNKHHKQQAISYNCMPKLLCKSSIIVVEELILGSSFKT